MILDLMRVCIVLMQKKAEQPFCGCMTRGEKEVIMITVQMLLRGKDLPDGSETVRACMARQQGTLAACGASDCQYVATMWHVVCGHYLKQQPTAGLLYVKEDVSDRRCQTSVLLTGCSYATSVHSKCSIKSFGKAGWHTTH